MTSSTTDKGVRKIMDDITKGECGMTKLRAFLNLIDEDSSKPEDQAKSAAETLKAAPVMLYSTADERQDLINTLAEYNSIYVNNQLGSEDNDACKVNIADYAEFIKKLLAGIPRIQAATFVHNTLEDAIDTLVKDGIDLSATDQNTLTRLTALITAADKKIKLRQPVAKVYRVKDHGSSKPMYPSGSAFLNGPHKPDGRTGNYSAEEIHAITGWRQGEPTIEPIAIRSQLKAVRPLPSRALCRSGCFGPIAVLQTHGRICGVAAARQ